MRKHLAIAAACLLAPALSAARPAGELATADGARYRVVPNDHGAVLHGAGGPVYLGRGCDAWSKRDGRGRWHWANGGVIVELGDTRLAFPRQELDVPGIAGCRG